MYSAATIGATGRYLPAVADAEALLRVSREVYEPLAVFQSVQPALHAAGGKAVQASESNVAQNMSKRIGA